MAENVSFDEFDASFSRFIAEALIARNSPREIVDRGEQLGLSPVACNVAVTACAATACDPTDKVRSVAFRARK